MDFIKTIYHAVREKYADILNDIEGSIFIFVEEWILSKNIALDTPIDYNSSNYAKDLKGLVESIATGLKSLQLSEKKVNSRFIHHYLTFSPRAEYKTLTDWIAYSFQPKIQYMIFTEILQYLTDHNSIIKKWLDLSLLSPMQLDKINKIKKEEPKLLQFAQWYFQAYESLTKKIETPELDYSNMLQFNEPERDLQSYYLGYSIAEQLNMQDEIADVSRISDFILSATDKWAYQNSNISEKYPMTLFCGVYLGSEMFLPLDRDAMKEILKKILVKIANSFKCPIFEDTYLVAYVLQACNLLDLKLTSKLVQGLTRVDEAIVDEPMLKGFSTARLAKVYQIYASLNVMAELPMMVRATIDQILESRKRENLFYNFDLDFMPSAEAIYGAFQIYSFEEKLDQFPYRENIDFSTSNLKENLFMLDFDLTGQLSDIFYGIKFISLIIELPQDISVPILTNYLFGTSAIVKAAISESTELPQISPVESEESVLDDPELFDAAPSESELFGGSTSESEMPAPLETPSIPQPAGFASTGPAQQELLPSRFADFFGNFPILIPDILDELGLNIAAVSKVRDSLFNSLSNLHRWVTCLKILNIDFPIPKEEIFKKTEMFRKHYGFGTDQGDIPDPLNTFYGLCIYSEFGLLDFIDLQSIRLYLIAEANNFNENMVLNNDYIFMSLKILAKHNYPMPDYNYLLPKILAVDPTAQNEQYNGLVDMIHYINLIRSIDPNYALSYLNDDYIREVQVAMEDDGSIGKKVTHTARVLIALYELGLQGIAEAKFLIKYLQYDAKFFIDIVKKEPIGWESDSLGFEIELGICYWTLVALTLIYPAYPPMDKSTVCPQCSKFFSKKPKFCNECGFRF